VEEVLYVHQCYDLLSVTIAEGTSFLEGVRVVRQLDQLFSD